MKKAKKILSFCLALMMLISCVNAVDAKAATFNDINQSGVFVKQQTNYTCTLASAVMLVRRTAMAAGNNNWSSITESSMRGTAWLEGSGLYYNFTYAGVSVGHSTIGSNRKSTYINLLKTYPQGVVAWNGGNGGQYHAVLLTDYDANTDTFYCADPANGTASGRIPLSSSSILGSGQDNKINNLDHYWYVKSPSITLTSNEPTSIIYPTSGATYKIASAVGNNQYLDFSLSTNNVQIYEDCDESTDPSWVKSQYFVLTHVGDGWYRIINVGNRKCVDVAAANPASGTNIQQCDYNGNNAQLYRFYDSGDGYCYIKSKLGCYVDVQNGDNFNNANVWAYTFNGTNAQKWKLIKKDVPTFDTEKPSISNVRITDINESGFTISCEVYDNIGIKQVLFPVWTTENGQDDIIYHKANLNGNTATCRINISDHNNSYGEYVCDPHIYDTSDNLLISWRLHINVPKFVAHCEGLAPLYTYDVSKNDSIEVSIWAFNLTGDEVDCYYQIDNGQLVYIERESRPDVVRVYPECKQIDCGFGLRLDASTFSEGTHNIKILAKSNGAEQYLFENNFVVVKPTFVASFNANGGACSTSNKSVKCGNTYGNLPTPTRAGYTFDGWYTSATGGTKVTASTKVTATSNHTLYAHWTCNHNTTEVRNEATPTCIETGYTGDTYCLTCGNKIKSGTVIDKVDCANNDGDDMCDYCEKDMSTPDEPEKNCSCNCHKGGISGFFFKLINFFEKLFGKNKVCKCGVKH